MTSGLRPPVEFMTALIQALATVLAAWIVTGGVEDLSDALSREEESEESIQVEVSRGYNSRLVAVAHNSGTGPGILMPEGTIIAINDSDEHHYSAVLGTSAGIIGSQEHFILGPGEGSLLNITVDLPNDVERCVLEFRTVRTVGHPRRSSSFECGAAQSADGPDGRSDSR